MNDLGEQLRRADPLAAEQPLDASDVRAMRGRVLHAARGAQEQRRTGQRALVVALAGALCLMGAVIAGTRYTVTDDPAPVVPVMPERPSVSRVYFETPGGTRVVWFLETTTESGRTR